MTKVAWVLYENHQTDENGFALHKLICRMVDDELGESWVAKDYVKGIPRKGNGNLLADCSEPEHAFGGLEPKRRFALVDGDKLAKPLGLPPGATLDEVRRALVDKYPGVTMLVPEATNVSASNTEQVLRDLATCMGWASDRPELRAALGKSRNARDKVFGAALGADGQRARQCLRQIQPPVDELVRKLAALVGPVLRAEPR